MPPPSALGMGWTPANRTCLPYFASASTVPPSATKITRSHFMSLECGDRGRWSHDFCDEIARPMHFPGMKHVLVCCCLVTACGNDTVSSDQQAKQAYMALDGAVAKSLALGFAGFDSASSANIAPQTA